ncbi:hypothetical protein HW555_005024 [Spodoptera exigua]|uniref:Uncharacterized protein n=1 Tax=Spodoptera exigua TaxID=7107 RepID=A0A835GJ66_SPOEX|nr:hypothetical protein HW555_005024 [Spodoptera exigua]
MTLQSGLKSFIGEASMTLRRASPARTSQSQSTRNKMLCSHSPQPNGPRLRSPPEPGLSPATPRTPPRIVRPWDASGFERLQRLQRLAGAALLDGERWRLAALGLLRPRDMAPAECCDSASERSSSASDCCSEPRRAPQQGSAAPHTPLDALFHMTSKTFEANNPDNGE